MRALTKTTIFFLTEARLGTLMEECPEMVPVFQVVFSTDAEDLLSKIKFFTEDTEWVARQRRRHAENTSMKEEENTMVHTSDDEVDVPLLLSTLADLVQYQSAPAGTTVGSKRTRITLTLASLIWAVRVISIPPSDGTKTWCQSRQC